MEEDNKNQGSGQLIDCPKCKGSGNINGGICPKCNGTGKVNLLLDQVKAVINYFMK